RIKDSGYSVGTASQMLQMFATDNQSIAQSNPDIILRLQRRVNQSQAVAGAWYNDRVGIGSTGIYMEIGRSFYNELDKLDPEFTGQPSYDLPRKDIRYSVIVHGESTIAGNYDQLSQDAYLRDDVLLVGKYPG